MQEVTKRTVDELASRLGMFSALAPAASGRGSAAGLLSRWPLRDVNLHPEAPLRNTLLEALVEPEGAAPLRIFVTHLAASYSAWRGGEGERLRELAASVYVPRAVVRQTRCGLYRPLCRSASQSTPARDELPIAESRRAH